MPVCTGLRFARPSYAGCEQQQNSAYHSESSAAQDVTSTVVEMAHNRWQQSLLLDVSKRLT